MFRVVVYVVACVGVFVGYGCRVGVDPGDYWCVGWSGGYVSVDFVHGGVVLVVSGVGFVDIEGVGADK